MSLWTLFVPQVILHRTVIPCFNALLCTAFSWRFPQKCEDRDERPGPWTRMSDLRESVEETWPSLDHKPTTDGARTIRRVSVCSGVMHWATGMSSPIRRGYEPNNQSPGPSGFRDPQAALLPRKLDHLFRGSGKGPQINSLL